MADRAVRSALSRDEFIDFCRAFSLIVVVMWHWVFTIVVWDDSGPTASNPIGFTYGLWILTWFFQVMPLFFFVGGFAHMKVWEKIRSEGGGYGQFLGSRLRRLALPALALAGTWIILGVIVGSLIYAPWLSRTIVLVISPLWFVAIYLVLVLVAPPALWLHRKFGPVVPVALAGVAMLADVARFAHKIEWVALVNVLVVWALCHQLGFFYEALVRAPRSVPDAMIIGGVMGMIALVLTRIYPASMVGVPGDRISNMTPPTLCIVALGLFQAGLAIRLRPYIVQILERARWRRLSELINRFALPLYLFHSTGFALAMGVAMSFGYRTPPEPTLDWWLQRPVWFILPLAFTLPVIFIFGKRWIRPPLADLPEARQSPSPVR